MPQGEEIREGRRHGAAVLDRDGGGVRQGAKLTEDVEVLGLRVRVDVDTPELLAAVRRAYRPLGSTRGEPTACMELRLNTVHRPATARPGAAPAGSGAGAPGPGPAASSPVVRVSGQRLLLMGAGVRGEADARLATARASVAPGWLEDPVSLAEAVLDTLTLFVLTRRGRIPVHAAAVLLDGAPIVLAGRSGSGKSTLALHALRAGWPVLTDDAVYVELGPPPRIWALHRPIHVPPDGVPGPGGARRMRRGRVKQAVEAAPPPIPCPAGEAALVLLERGGSLALAPLGVEEAAAAMDAALEPGFDAFRDALPRAVRVLAGRGAWRLTPGRDPALALRALRSGLG